MQSAKLLGYSDLLGNPFAAVSRIGGDVSSLQAALLSGEASAIAGGVSGLALGAVGTVAATSSKITGGARAPVCAAAAARPCRCCWVSQVCFVGGALSLAPRPALVALCNQPCNP